ncbi:riboflavin synthase [Bacillus solimangrovi]|uniref:Riboflavin synthase n=1 Tax=Bacillus solimangrovi TaxID=1305675 RepID=A0A1E5LHU4_9BACI|nr:riboflavin synthase [Bacillus solimangrovi]OEH93653.1 riboflavin synthase subunit alpha [Bacillus solimangrovi]
MFTGIVEEIGSIVKMNRTKDAIVMTIGAKTILEDVNLGDSIAVNGVCLTVTSFSEKSFTVDVMPETVKSTSLNAIKEGSTVNLERAMAAGGRFGGHFVSGHVDGTGKIRSRKAKANAIYYEIEVPNEILRYIVLKGSVAVDGTSLTVFGTSAQTFTVSLIPHTLEETILGSKVIGDIVNIECDMLAKYIERFLEQRMVSTTSSQSNLSEHFLKEHGY